VTGLLAGAAGGVISGHAANRGYMVTLILGCITNVLFVQSYDRVVSSWKPSQMQWRHWQYFRALAVVVLIVSAALCAIHHNWWGTWVAGVAAIALGFDVRYELRRGRSSL